MNHRHTSRHSAVYHLVQFVVAILLSTSLLGQSAFAQADSAPTAADIPAWLEPRGLNIVDLAGAVPDEQLQGAVITYATGTGILEYMSGKRTLDKVEITVRATPRYFVFGAVTFTKLSCLGQPAAYDQWPSTVPASTMRLFADGRDITNKIDSMSTIPAGQVLPTYNASEYYRYPEPAAKKVVIQNGVLSIPANMGCTIIVNGKYTNLTATFTVDLPQTVKISHLGSETFVAHSYIGPGGGGILTSLNSQMKQRFGDRHEKFKLTVPANADYVFVNFPPTSTDPYAGEDPLNRPLAGSGTYRLQSGGGGLSVDHVAGAGLTIFGQWQDSDQTGNSKYLTYFTDAARLGSVEYFLPPGIPYDPCMTNGGCPNELIDQINKTTYNITVHYYKVERTIAEGLDRIPLKMVGKGWSAANPLAVPSTIVSGERVAHPAATGEDSIVYLPLITFTEPQKPIPPDDSSGCPCGWFDANGRMVDFIQQP